MLKSMLVALSAGAMFWAVPCAAQELPVRSGDYWDVTSVKIDDGHFGDYADFLAGQFRRENDFAKSKRWIKGYHILQNVNARGDEPDLYLVRVFDHVPTPAEDIKREKETNAYMQMNTRQSLAGSGQRATFRHLTGSMLLQELLFSR
jgi:hypothetical protein